MAYYERHRIEAIGLGLITMRKRIPLCQPQLRRIEQSIH